MKLSCVRIAVLTLILGAIGVSSARADGFYVSVGNTPPPPNRYERPWARPYETAVWIPGHHEWRYGRYYWVPGYYTYPPRGRKVWVDPGYQHAPNGYYYRPGYWR